MNLRITPQTRIGQNLNHLQRQTADLFRLQEQASSGLRLLRPSDDPSALMQVLTGKADDQRLGVYLDNLGDARGYLDHGVAALQDVSAALTQARQIALEGANAPLEPSSLEALAQEVDNLVDRLVQAGNTQKEGIYLFGGSSLRTEPFVVSAVDSEGRPVSVTNQGCQDRTEVLIGKGSTVDTLYAGSEIFQSEGVDAFGTLIRLRDALRSAAVPGIASQAANLSQLVGEIDTVKDHILASTGEMSVSLQRIDALQARWRDLQTEIKGQTSEKESADMAEVLISLRSQENLFQLTLGVVGRMFDQNLLDFLR